VSNGPISGAADPGHPTTPWNTELRSPATNSGVGFVGRERAGPRGEAPADGPGSSSSGDSPQEAGPLGRRLSNVNDRVQLNGDRLHTFNDRRSATVNTTTQAAAAHTHHLVIGPPVREQRIPEFFTQGEDSISRIAEDHPGPIVLHRPWVNFSPLTTTTTTPPCVTTAPANPPRSPFVGPLAPGVPLPTTPNSLSVVVRPFERLATTTYEPVPAEGEPLPAPVQNRKPARRVKKKSTITPVGPPARPPPGFDPLPPGRRPVAADDVAIDIEGGVQGELDRPPIVPVRLVRQRPEQQQQNGSEWITASAGPPPREELPVPEPPREPAEVRLVIGNQGEVTIIDRPETPPPTLEPFIPPPSLSAYRKTFDKAIAYFDQRRRPPSPPPSPEPPTLQREEPGGPAGKVAERSDHPSA
jgi:hypothetical protein